MKVVIAMLAVWAVAGCEIYGQDEEQSLPVYSQQPPVYQQQPPPAYSPDQPPPAPAQEQPEVLTSGPVHEAFAEPVDLQDQPGIVAPQPPPPSIQEMPPADRPQGAQYVWVPGYWAWSAERNGYIWVSGCWRAGPPNTYWVPGYWAQTAQGYAWVAGFWAPSGVQQIMYLPAPPMYADVEAPGPSPSPEVIWVPPCAYWQRDHYVRREGYWLRQQQGWMWTPSHYIWTPRGYVFVDGGWDYTLDRRGVLFAPVYFPTPVYAQPAFMYSPSFVIDLGALEVNLFTYPQYCHYYFGDYYADTYRSRGIYPWFEVEQVHTWYDPIFSYNRWVHVRTDPQWVQHQRQDFDRRRADPDLRPARTYRETEARMNRVPEAQRRDVELARPLSAAVTNRTGPVNFERMNDASRKRVATQATETQRYREQRNRWESTPATRTAPPATEHRGATAPQAEQRRGLTPEQARPGAAAPPTERGPTPAATRAAPPSRPETVNIPRSPISAGPAGADRREAAPPARPNEERQNAPSGRGQGPTGGNRDREQGR